MSEGRNDKAWKQGHQQSNYMQILQAKHYHCSEMCSDRTWRYPNESILGYPHYCHELSRYVGIKTSVRWYNPQRSTLNAHNLSIMLRWTCTGFGIYIRTCAAPGYRLIRPEIILPDTRWWILKTQTKELCHALNRHFSLICQKETMSCIPCCWYIIAGVKENPISVTCKKFHRAPDGALRVCSMSTRRWLNRFAWWSLDRALNHLLIGISGVVNRPSKCRAQKKGGPFSKLHDSKLFLETCLVASQNIYFSKS